MILVTGGLGMLGAHTARALVDLGHDLVVAAHRRTEVPDFDVPTAVADYVAWRADNPR